MGWFIQSGNNLFIRIAGGFIHGERRTEHGFARADLLAAAADRFDQRCNSAGFAGFTDADDGDNLHIVCLEF